MGTKPVNEDGDRIYYSDINQQNERDAATGNIAFNKMMYADTTFNFFAPYYRQVTMETVSLPDESLEQRITTPYSDIKAAFAEYIATYNEGRPFILLGHSQGSDVLIRLLEEMDQEPFDRMVAAYTFGWKISEKLINEYPTRIIPAQGENDLHVIITYNTVTDLNAVSPVINETDVCINPLNWKTDETPASKELHLGTLLYNQSTGTFDTVLQYTGVYMNQNFLIATEVDPSYCYIEEYEELFPLGNLHFMDSYLYGFNIQKNMRDRLLQYQTLH